VVAIPRGLLAERRVSPRLCRDDLPAIGDDGTLRDAGLAELRFERERRARDQRQLHVLPVLAGEVLHHAPGLQISLAALVDGEAIRGPPHRRLGDVPHLEVVRLAVEAEHDALEMALLVLGLLARLLLLLSLLLLVLVLFDLHREGDRAHGAAAGLADGERREEVADLGLLHLEADLALLDMSGALEIGDAVAIDDDPPEGEPIDADRGLSPTSDEREEKRERSAEAQGREHVAIQQGKPAERKRICAQDPRDSARRIAV
jgi:hypothetical protein